MKRGLQNAVALLLLGSTPLLAQQDSGASSHPRHARFVDRWTIEHGLPGAITSVAETPDGTLWIGTVAGLVRFDGESFDVYDRNRVPELGFSRVRALAAARDSSLLVFDLGGRVVRWADGQIAASFSFDGPAVKPADHDGLLDSRDFWAWRSRVLYHVRDDRPEPVSTDQIFGTSVGGGSIEITDVAVSRGGDVWVASTAGLARRRGAGWEVMPADGLPDGTIVDLFVDPHGRLWVSTYGGISVRGLSGVFSVVERRSPGMDLTIDVAAAGNRTVWARSQRRVRQVRLDETSNSVRAETLWERELTEGNTTGMVVDRLGNLWVGTDVDGLSRISFAPARRLGVEQGIPERAVRHVIGDGNGGILFSSGCGDLMRWSGETLERFARLEGTGRACVTGLMLDSRGGIWVGHGEEAVRYAEGEARSWTWGEDGSVGPVTPMLEDSRGNVWIGAKGMVAVVRPDGEMEELGADVGLPADHVWSLAETPDGSIWVGQAETLSRWTGESFEVFGAADGVPVGVIRVLHANPDGALWIGSYGGGMSRFEGGEFSTITREQGLFDNSISAILADGRDRLWILGNRGVFMASRAAFDAIANRTASGLDGVYFGPRDGVPEGNGGAPAAWLDSDGTAWFASIDGLISLDIAVFPYDTTPPRARIEGLAVAHGEIQPGEPQVVPPGSGPVTIAYGVPGLPAARPYRYRYRLVGLNEQWVEAGTDRVARFANLPPGRYEFQVVARSPDGIWQHEPTRARLRVKHAWWQLPAVRLLALAAAAILLGAYVSGRLRRAEARNRQLEQEMLERERAEERARRHQRELEHLSRLSTAGELASSLAHELSQPLTAIAGNAVVSSQMLSDPSADSEAIREAINDIVGDSQRASEIIRKLRSFVGRQQLEKVGLDVNALIHEVAPLFRRELNDHGIQLDLELEPGLPRVEGDRIQLQQVLVNLVLNASDALKAGPDEGRRIVIRSRVEDNSVRILVSDNGPGIDESELERVFEPFFTTKADGMGIGLSLCTTIMEEHDGRLAAKRLSDQGVTFEMTLPANAP